VEGKCPGDEQIMQRMVRSLDFILRQCEIEGVLVYRAAITKCHRLCDLNNRHLLPYGFGG
jgi:hypothetical protein